MKLLLIEDEQELANSIISYLTVNSFVCEWANNVKTAIDKISIFDCILQTYDANKDKLFNIPKFARNNFNPCIFY